MKPTIFKRISMSILLLAQLGLYPAVAMADESASPTPVVTASPSDSLSTPSPSEQPSDSPSLVPDPPATSSPVAGEVSPSDSPSLSPDSTASVGPTVSTGPTTSTGPTSSTGARTTGPTTATGPDVPTGTIPAYAFNVKTRFWVPTDRNSFTWDSKSGYWLSPLYFFDPASGYYEIFDAGVTRPDNLLTAPGAVATPLGLVAPGSQSYALAKTLGLLPGDPFMGSTGPNSNNSITESNNNNATFDLTNLVNVVNALHSNATSGDASVSGNTQAGDAKTGTATVVANLVNLLSSAWSWSNGALNYFMSNMFGNHTGDINLNPVETVTGGGGGYGPNNIGTTGPNSNNTIATNTNDNLTVRRSDTTGITNNLNLAALTGNAGVSGNTQAGNANSGDATVDANIINLINSYINAGDSFFGILNLFGNLNGDILFPNGFLDNAIGSGAGGGGTDASIGTTGAGSNNSISDTTTANTNLRATADNAIANNISTSAKSGNATIANNTSAGNATTGDARTNQALYNLDNTSLFGDNAVLVIVNVMGHWLGHIMHIPDSGGSSSALLTGGATAIGTTGPGSNNAVSSTNNANTNISSNQTGRITNNINATAQSGDASVTGNTQAGNAATGAARVASNVANIINSGINVKHWFGVLVINVFGDWFGSVGDNTAAGNDTAGKGSGGQPVSALAAAALPHAAVTTNHSNEQSTISSGSPGSAGTGESGTTLAATNTGSNSLAAIHQPISSPTGTKDPSSNVLLGLSIALLLIAGGLTTIERKIRAQ